MMNVKNILNNFSIALLAQLVSLCLSLVTSFVVPKLLGIEEFAYWQLFMFYVSYSNITLFGLYDGIYLINGGKTRAEINARSISAQFQFAIVQQLLVALAIIVWAYCANMQSKYLFTAIAVAIYALFFNLTSFLGYLFQAINETKLFSLQIIISKVVFIFPLICLLFLHITDFEYYVVCFTFGQIAALVFCLLKAKNLLVCRVQPIKQCIVKSFESISVGFKLMLANLMSMLILGITRWCVNDKWGLTVFGEIAFSLSLISLFILFVSQLAMVLFPALKRASIREQKKTFYTLSNVFGLLLPSVCVLYFPASVFVGIWLPQYQISLLYFAWFLPICIFNSRMDLIGTTFFKVCRKENELFKINLATMCFVLATTLIGAYIIEEIWVVVMSPVVGIAIRSVVSEFVMTKHLDVKFSSIVFQDILFSVIFVCATTFFQFIQALFITLFCFAIMIALNYKQLLLIATDAKMRLHNDPNDL